MAPAHALPPLLSTSLADTLVTDEAPTGGSPTGCVDPGIDKLRATGQLKA